MKILIPIDGSDNARATLEWAASVLNRTENEFYLLTIITEPELAEYRIEDATKALADGKNYLTNQGFKVAKAEYMLGDPVEAICTYANDENVNQVMIGSHGRTGLAKMLLGSVSQGVLERCKQPVFIYRNRQEQMAQSPL